MCSTVPDGALTYLIITSSDGMITSHVCAVITIKICDLQVPKLRKNDCNLVHF